MSTRSFTIAVAFILATITTRANNISVTSPVLTGNTGTTALIQFNLSWANSWRGGGVANRDAAWVFVKYRTIGGTWFHAYLNNTGHTAPAGSQIDLGLRRPAQPYNASTNLVVGAFIYRNATGTGTFTLTGVQLLWDYTALGLNYNDIAQVEVFAIEVVHVPQGAFVAGSGGTETNGFTLTTINTASPLVAPGGTGSLGGQAGGYPTNATHPPAQSYPNGFDAFYSMKYELSQQGYVDFLNTLTYAQQLDRTANAPSSVTGTGAMITGNTNRNGIDIQVPGVPNGAAALYACNLDGDGVYGEATDGKDLACNFLSAADLLAYFDWSGLRPMSELEFEKACRGPVPATINEYPWGTNTLASSAYTVVNGGANNEGITTNYSTTAGNAAWAFTASVLGPMRTGIFAANAGNTGRMTSGSSYYGIMEMGGNLWERAIAMDVILGHYWDGDRHGNGVVGDSYPDPVDWPPLGLGFRGGAVGSPAVELRVSDRSSAEAQISTRNNNAGGRGVRTAP